MCGISNYEINGEEYELFLGYAAGELRINDKGVYRMEDPGIYPKLTKTFEGDRTAAKLKLAALGADNLAELILGWVENAEEG